MEIAKVNPGLIGIYFRYRRLISDSRLRTLGIRHEPLDLTEDFQVQDQFYQDSYIPADLVASVARLDTSFYMQNILLRDSDVFGMANSLEIRVPFLDRDLVEWAFGLPGSVLLPRGAPPKYLLRKICSKLYARPQIAQQKRGFVIPFSVWLKGPLRQIMEESLQSLRNSGLLNPLGIDSIRERFRRERNGSAWSRVWALMTLGHWLITQGAAGGAATVAPKSSRT